MALKDQFQSADWKVEKHAPVVELLGEPRSGEGVDIRVSVGREIAHPNTTEHHIAWFDLYFRPDGEKYPVHLGRYEFAAHGAGLKGPNTGGVLGEPLVHLRVKFEKPGEILASSYCNIHGLWESSCRVDF